MPEWFRPPPFSDPSLGELRRSGGIWRGTVRLGSSSVPLAVHGPRSAPDPRALEIARAVPTSYADWRDVIAAAMFDHYAPYAEAVAAGESEPPGAGLPRILRPDHVWPLASVEFVAVVPVDADLAVEIGYRVAWDEEHMLGARLRNGQLIELNGSVLPP